MTRNFKTNKSKLVSGPSLCVHGATPNVSTKKRTSHQLMSICYTSSVRIWRFFVVFWQKIKKVPVVRLVFEASITSQKWYVA